VTARDAAFMRRALELARRGWATTHPNPMVGAVLVRDGDIVGEGFHTAYGAPHAEVEAIRVAGDDARGATLYVTLEPCAHHGKTPPCTDAILAAGISRVVFAAADPTVEAGGGAAVLRAAGVDVTGGMEADAARALNASFFRCHERGAPFIALKLAMSVDGCIAAAPGQRTRITGDEAMARTHLLRAGHEAVMVGAATARIDDPLLTVRGIQPRVPPVRVVVDSGASLSTRSRLVATIEQAPVWVLCADDAPAERERALTDAGVQVLRLPRAAGGVDLHEARRALAANGIRSVLAEGGATLASALIREGVADRIHLFIAPRFLGRAGVPAFVLDGPLEGWRMTGSAVHGADLLLTLEPAPAPAEHH
jgi:diaminohydroxyphosphoribosylaminopyrimidine deaminase / 5-amino-6-(5-phosphoribosylamino)uracil reductase